MIDDLQKIQKKFHLTVNGQYILLSDSRRTIQEFKKYLEKESQNIKVLVKNYEKRRTIIRNN